MARDFEEMFGQKVGQGAQATVYAKGDFAVKLYREGYPKRNVFSEAYVMANLDQENFPSPKVYEVLMVDNRYGLRMDLLKGTPVENVLVEAAKKNDISKLNETINSLVELQIRLQKHNFAGDWTANLKIRFRRDITDNNRLSDDIQKKLLEILDGLPDGDALCHCDFHSGNIFIDGTEYTIIDLLQISKGDPAADAACSYVAYCFTSREVGDYYLDKYCEMSGILRENVLAWLPVYAGTLLGQLPEELEPLLEEFISMGG